MTKARDAAEEKFCFGGTTFFFDAHNTVYVEYPVGEALPTTITANNLSVRYAVVRSETPPKTSGRAGYYNGQELGYPFTRAAVATGAVAGVEVRGTKLDEAVRVFRLIMDGTLKPTSRGETTLSR